MLEAGKALRFAILPGGMDPDDLIKAQGPAAMQKVLEAHVRAHLAEIEEPSIGL